MQNDNSIFTDEAEVNKGMRMSAEALGIDPDLVAPDEQKTRYYAKYNCRQCRGRGTIFMVPSPQKQKVFSTTWSPVGKISKVKKEKRGPSQSKNKIINGFSPAADELNKIWNTRRPEPVNYKREHGKNYLCRCVQTVKEGV